MPNVLITGAGTIGAAVGREFVNKNYNVIFYDISEIPPAATADFIREVKDKVTFVKGDVMDSDFIMKTIEKHKIEGIVNTAFMGMIVPKTKIASSFRNNVYPNIDLVENILEIARFMSLKVINISSIAAYGTAVSSGKWPPDKPITEEDIPQLFPMAPPGPYDMAGSATQSCIKRIIEELVNFYFQEYRMHVCSIRPGSVYGPLDTHLNLPVIMMRRALAGKQLIIPHGRDHVMNHTFTRDLAKAVYLAFSAKPLKRSVYNITGGRLWKQGETAEVIMKAVPGSDIQLGPGMFPNGIYGVTFIRPPISIKAAQEELDYMATPLEQGIKETAEWMKNNWKFVPAGYFKLLPDSWWVK